MMRDIKFRVWDRTVKVMAKVNQINFYSDYTYPQVVYRYKDPRTGKVTDERANFGWDDGCDIVRVMQYTGLKDSNGKEIYEGDILGHKSLRTGKVITTGVVEFSEESEYAIRELVEDFGHFVIGNVYNHPDAFKEGK